MPAYRNLVGGELVDGVDGATREVLNPATGEVLARVPEGTGADVERAVAAARAARPGFRDPTPGRRQELLLEMAAVLDRHAEELAAPESANVGKPRSLAAEEMPVCSDELRFFAGAARTGRAPSAGEYGKGYTSFVRREPVGIVGQIAPWNYPLMMASWKIAPALAAGNVVVLKPSELTPLSTLRFAELIADVLPPGVLNVVTGDCRTWERRSSSTPTSRWSRSPAASGPASGSRAPRLPRSSASTSSWAARRRSSCSTTPTLWP
jgi:acyl-CoA reductase-like NAD-dependent aldehyde dehydrogenase